MNFTINSLDTKVNLFHVAVVAPYLASAYFYPQVGKTLPYVAGGIALFHAYLIYQKMQMKNAGPVMNAANQ
jgi:hypothetical protein